MRIDNWYLRYRCILFLPVKTPYGTLDSKHSRIYVCSVSIRRCWQQIDIKLMSTDSFFWGARNPGITDIRSEITSNWCFKRFIWGAANLSMAKPPITKQLNCRFKVILHLVPAKRIQGKRYLQKSPGRKLGDFRGHRQLLSPCECGKNNHPPWKLKMSIRLSLGGNSAV